MDKVVEAAVAKHGDAARHTGSFAIIDNFHGVGKKEEFYNSVKENAISGIKVVRNDHVCVKKPDEKVKEHDFFSYGGYIYPMSALQDLDLIGPVVSVSMLEYELRKEKYECDDEEFSWAYDSDEEKEFHNSSNCHTLFLDDNAGNCMVVATFGSVEGNAKFVPERKVEYTLEQFMIKTSDPFGDF